MIIVDYDKVFSKMSQRPIVQMFFSLHRRDSVPQVAQFTAWTDLGTDRDRALETSCERSLLSQRCSAARRPSAIKV